MEEKEEKKGRWPNWRLLACIGASAMVAPSAAVMAVHGLGFGAGGIATGTWASSFMASYGGHVGAGSLCSVLQSVGAAGLATKGALAASAAAASATASVGAAALPVVAIAYKGASAVVAPVAGSLTVVRDAGGGALSLAAKGASAVVVPVAGGALGLVAKGSSAVAAPVASGLATAWGIGSNAIGLAHDRSSAAAADVVKVGSSAVGTVAAYANFKGP